MFMPRHPQPLLSTKAVATLVVQQRQQRHAVDKQVLIVETRKPLKSVAVPLPKPGSD